MRFSWPGRWWPCWKGGPVKWPRATAYREEYATHTQQGLSSRKCGSSIPPKWILKLTYLHCSHSNRKTILTYSHGRLCKRNCRRGKNNVRKRKFNEVPFFHLCSQLRITICTFGNLMGNGISCCNMNLLTLSVLFIYFLFRHSVLQTFLKQRAIKMWEPAVLTNLKHFGT